MRRGSDPCRSLPAHQERPDRETSCEADRAVIGVIGFGSPPRSPKQVRPCRPIGLIGCDNIRTQRIQQNKSANRAMDMALGDRPADEGAHEWP